MVPIDQKGKPSGSTYHQRPSSSVTREISGGCKCWSAGPAAVLAAFGWSRRFFQPGGFRSFDGLEVRLVADLGWPLTEAALAKPIDHGFACIRSRFAELEITEGQRNRCIVGSRWPAHVAEDARALARPGVAPLDAESKARRRPGRARTGCQG